MKKLFITFLCLMMVAVFMPTMAFAAVSDTDVAKIGDTGYATLEEAVNAVNATDAGGTIELLKDAKASELRLKKPVTFNMNGHKITGASDAQFMMRLSIETVVATFNEGTIEVTNTTPGSVGIHMQGGTLNFNQVTMNIVTPNGTANPCYTYGIQGQTFAGYNGAYDKAVLNINNSTINEVSNGLDAEKNGVVVAVTAFGMGDPDSAVLNMSNTDITVGGYSVSGNGTNHGTNFTLTNCNLNSEKAVGIYHPQNGDMVIDGGSVTGTSGVEVRAGNVTVKGGAKITGTAKPESVDGNGNGTTTMGAGIAVAQHSTKFPINVVVEDADVSGTSAVLASNTEGNAAEDIEKVNVEIKGGNFEGQVQTNDGGKMSASGGTFEKIGEKVEVVADDVAKVTEDGVTKTVLGLDNINESLKDAPAGTLVEVTKATEGANIVAPVGVTVENQTAAAVKVNDTELAAGTDVTVEAPEEDPQEPTDPEEPTNPEEPTDPADTDEPGADKPDDKKPAKEPAGEVSETGDETTVLPWIALMILTAGAAAALKKRENI